MKALAVSLSALLCVAFAGAHAADLATDEQKQLYSLGVAISQSLGEFGLSDTDLEVVKAGLSDGILKRTLKVDAESVKPNVQQLVKSRGAVVAAKEKKAGTGYLAKAAAEPGAKKTASGAIVTTLKEGKGPSPKASDTVKVHYQGTLVDGTVFDSSIQRGQPATFPLANVIKCWTEGVQEIKVGGKSRLVCPADIAYGDRGSPPAIKPGATLVFEVELLEIVK